MAQSPAGAEKQDDKNERDSGGNAHYNTDYCVFGEVGKTLLVQ